MKAQFFSGYILSTVQECLSTYNSTVNITSLLSQLSAFDVEYNFDAKFATDPIVSVYENIIARGQPTLPSLFVEETISSALNIAVKESDEQRLSSIVFKPTIRLTALEAKIYKSLFVIDPRIKILDSQYYRYEPLDYLLPNENELFFITKTLPKRFGEAFCQLIETQREIVSTINPKIERKFGINEAFRSSGSAFVDQRLDFSFDLPSADRFTSGLAIEIDGPQHREQSQMNLDAFRDKILLEIGWEPTIRLRTKELVSLPPDKQEALSTFLHHPYCIKVVENFRRPIWADQDGLEALQIALSPFGIARVQKGLLFLLQNGVLKFSDEKWTIAVIERDVPCAYLALADMQQTFEQLFTLEGKGRKLPRIHLKVFRTKEFVTCKLNDGVDAHPIEGFDPSVPYDAVLDISVLQRSGFSFPNEVPLSKNKNTLRIRSVHSSIAKPKVLSAKPIKYVIPKTNPPEPLVFFLQNIFRKKQFLEGQVDILRKTLALESVIALLPTGAGKSLTYQLSALLQPGITLVIDPIKALMRDQDQNLHAIGVDSTTFINSSISAEDRNIRSQEMVEGRYQFVFVSPERLQIQEFRTYLGMMTDTYFTYSVIDEAHCVSEWGHDFRTAYLRLGENVRKYCRVFPKSKDIPLIGLTGTASYDVLSDVQRELFVTSKYAIVSPSKYEREELIFKIEKIPDPLPLGNVSESKIRKAVADAKYDRLTEILRDLPNREWSDDFSYYDVEDFFSREYKYPNSGIIFCPHVNWIFGVNNVASKVTTSIPELSPLIDVYAGSLSDTDPAANLEETQTRFKSDQLGLLVATKAFGMGIDKPNIRFTIHFSMPQSIESFYQEAGRAGRDKCKSYCYILHSGSLITAKDSPPISVDKDLMLTFFHNSFPGQAKENQIMWDLLDEITLPSQSISERINLEELDLGHYITLKLWKNSRIYANGAYPASFGYIDLRDERIVPENRPGSVIVGETEARRILTIVLAKIRSTCPPGVSVYRWITDDDSAPVQPGIEEILAGLEAGESKVLIVPFTNNMLSSISQFASSFGYDISESDVHDSYRYCFDAEEFVIKLFDSERTVRSIPTQRIEKIKSDFLKVRGEQDTFRAIYRLSIIGVVDDYVVDYNTKTITATISKKSDQEYLRSLAEYIGRYDSPENRSKVDIDIAKTSGNTMIQKCCRYLTSFVYGKIAAKREEAINVMEDAIKSENFSEYVNTYFDSRFTPHFRKYLYKNSIDWIWSFLTNNAINKDSISNIRGACDRLLVENPTNPAFLLLRSYSKFTNLNYDKSDALDDLHRGWASLQKAYNLLDSDFLPILNKFYNQVINYDRSLGGYLNQVFFEYHVTWLSSFVHSFLEEE